MLRLGGKDVPETLDELAVPEKTAIVVIDMPMTSAPRGHLPVDGRDLTLYRPAIAALSRCSQRPASTALVVHTQFTVPDTYATESHRICARVG